MMKMLDLDVVGDFLVMAATLMQIKSKMLLPPDPLASPTAEQEDPRDELVRRLEEYKKFKEIAETLKTREQVRQDFFRRVVDEDRLNEIKQDAEEVTFEATLFDLINALNAALKGVPEKKTYELEREEYTVEEKIHALLHLLADQPRVSLAALFGRCSGKDEIVCTFIAVLELIRLKEIAAVQRRAFEDIEVLRNG
ncbi:MAG: segregation/condensation protein A [Candidatus Omnitrophica bacterium]|nr:segregation/condensation protein A [Candidatus Omnitrophota bacterium]